MQTGVEFPIFIDQTDILIGERWRQRIDRTLDSSTLLITMITPSFFKSDQCRDEVSKFRKREEALGLDDLIVPVYYVQATEMQDRDTSDEMGSDLQGRQYADWRDLRFETLDFPETRRRLAGLAKQIADRIRRPVETLAADRQADKKPLEKSPGAIEVMASMEEAFPLLTSVLEGLTEVGSDIARIASAAAADMERGAKQPNAARGQLAAIQRYAKRLTGPAEQTTSLAAEYAYQIERVDAGVNGVATLIQFISDTDELQQAIELQETLEELAEQARGGIGAIRSLIEVMSQQHAISSTIRSGYHAISDGFGVVVESLPQIESWAPRVERAIQDRERSELRQ